MDPGTLKLTLIAVIRQIQVSSELDCPPLIGSTKPAEEVPKFDSLIWPIAATIVSSEIGIQLPDDVNLFVDGKSKKPLSIDQSVALLCDLLESQQQMEAVSA